MMDGTQLWKNWFAIRPGFLLAFFLFCLQGLRELLEKANHLGCFHFVGEFLLSFAFLS
jgi:hypothetical protein